MPAQDPGSTDKDLRIRDVKAYPTSYPIPPGQSVTLGIGRAEWDRTWDKPSRP